MDNKEEMRKQRQIERFLNKSKQSSAKYIRKLKELKGVPNNSVYFIKRLNNIFVKNMEIEKEEDQLTIGTFCAMVPQELIYAAGARPIKLCSGNYTAFSIGDDTMPRDSCPLVKAIVGSIALGCVPVYKNCSLFVVPTTCDCKKKLAYQLQEFKEVYPLHIPSDKSCDYAVEAYVKELYGLKYKLEELTGQTITYRRLREAIQKVALTQYEISRFYEHKKRTPSLIKGTHAMAIMNSYSYDEVERWGNSLRLLNDELDMKQEKGEYVGKETYPRILVTGSPIVFPNIKIPLLIEEMGGLVVADETCMGERGLYDPVSIVDESLDGLMRALAKRYLLPCTCPTFVKNDQRIYRIKEMIQEHQVKGVIYHVLRGCLVYDYEFAMLEEELNKIGIPVIRLESDYNEEDIEQLRIRIEAFIEMIKFQ